MVFRILKYLGLMVFVAFFSSCSTDVDFSGFVRSTDRVEDRFVQSMQWNENHPFQTIQGGTNYQILLAADTHIGGTENLSYLKELYNDGNYKGMVIIGDIVSGKEEDYQLYIDSVADVTKPIFSIVGNHDLYFDGWKYFYKYLGSSTYYFTVEANNNQKDLFICLDSGGGTLGKSQIDWLENLLDEKRSNHRHIIVLSHVNILRTRRTTSATPMTEEVIYLLDLFARYGVDYVITGHYHVQDEAIFGNTKYLILDALKDENPDAGYAELNVLENSVEHEFVRF